MSLCFVSLTSFPRWWICGTSLWWAKSSAESIIIGLPSLLIKGRSFQACSSWRGRSNSVWQWPGVCSPLASASSRTSREIYSGLSPKDQDVPPRLSETITHSGFLSVLQWAFPLYTHTHIHIEAHSHGSNTLWLTQRKTTLVIQFGIFFVMSEHQEKTICHFVFKEGMLGSSSKERRRAKIPALPFRVQLHAIIFWLCS